MYERDVFKLTNGDICWYTFSRRCSYVYMWLRKWHCHMRLLHDMFSKLDIIQSSATLYKLRKSDITTSNDAKKTTRTLIVNFEIYFDHHGWHGIPRGLMQIAYNEYSSLVYISFSFVSFWHMLLMIFLWMNYHFY